MSLFEIHPGRTLDAAKRRSTVVIGHPYMARGGSEAVVMWLLQALQEDHDLTILTTGGWDLAELNSYYGTRIREAQVKVRIASVPWPVRNLTVAALRGACFQRFARAIAGEYDLRISAYNPTDWGLPAIHFIADFSWRAEIRDKIDPPSPGIIYRDFWLRRSYLSYAASCSSPSGRDVLKEDCIVANSQWTAEMLRKHCGIQCAAVVYPPVCSQFPEVAWAEKEQAFVMIGRIAPEKRIERAIAILLGVRERGHAIRLHLCGQFGQDSYSRSLANLCERNAEWIRLEGSVSGAGKSQILTRCRYGIHARNAEPFGISVAEMIKAGAIVFAPQDGGQEEIIGHPDLLFESQQQAIDKICAVLSSGNRQSELRAHLELQSSKFSADNFMRASAAVIASQ